MLSKDTQLLSLLFDCLILFSDFFPFSEMNGELIALPLMYTVTVASTGQLFAESNDSFISTLCSHNNWNWSYETINCNIIMQIDEVDVIRLAPLRSDFMEQSVRN